jgi:hypothetical protein
MLRSFVVRNAGRAVAVDLLAALVTNVGDFIAPCVGCFLWHTGQVGKERGEI